MIDNSSITSIDELHSEFGIFSEYVITKKGTLIAGIEFEGKDPDGLSEQDFAALSIVTKNIYQALPNNITITQYYNHYNNDNIKLKKRNHPVCNLLSEKRQQFLNKKNISNSKIVHYFEIYPDTKSNELNIQNFVTNLIKSPFCEKAREKIINSLSYDNTLVYKLSELKKLASELNNCIQEVKSKWSMLLKTSKMSKDEMWRHIKFLSNLNSEVLNSKEDAPEDSWDSLLSESDKSEVNINNNAFFKIHDIKPIYAKIMAVTKFGKNNVDPGMWSKNSNYPTQLSGNYIIMIRFTPLSKIQKQLLFHNKKSELKRRTIDLNKLISGSNEENLKPKIKQQLNELEQAELIEDKWGMVHSFIINYSHNTDELIKESNEMKKSLTNSNFSVCVEDIDLPFSWKTFLPAGKENSIRDVPFTTSQFGACSLIYQATKGQETVKDLDKEEAQYIFIGQDSTPFHYNPFVGGRAMVFGVGPIRSGKSFTKNTLATHFLKYGGMFRALDIDKGTEPIAEIFKEDAGIFNVQSGFNPFIMACSHDDLDFINHLKNQIISMIKTNDNKELQQISLNEQKELDEALIATLKLPKELQNLSTAISHCSITLQSKLARFLKSGMYGHLFDQKIDSIGSLNKMIGIFNLSSVKNDKNILPLIMSEIFFRVIKLFESNEYKHLPKLLDIDEAHLLLKNKYIVEKITQFVRTWGKYKAGLSMWSQSPKEFLDLKDWPALKSAASTFFFMSDPKMDEELYQKTFNLTKGECQTIKNLIPKKEAYIVQPEIGVSKKIILEVEKEQYIISTSSPNEVLLRERNIKKYGLELGIEKTITELEL